MKKQKLAYLEDDVIQDMESNPFFNFSEWIEEKYREEFMSLSLIDIYKQRITRLQELNNNKEIELPKEQQRFFQYEDGFKNFEVFKDGLLKRFNYLYGTNYNLKQFQYLFKKYGRK